MGAGVSSERGRTTKQKQVAEFERKYREMYGPELSPDDLLERYRLEKLKADRQQRSQQTYSDRGGDQKSHRLRGDERMKPRDRHHDESRRRQQQNFDIIRAAYDRNRRSEHEHKYDDRRRRRSHRKDGDYDDSHKDRSSRRRRSSRDRNDRRSSPPGSAQGHGRSPHSPRKQRSSEHRPNSERRNVTCRPGSAEEIDAKISRDRPNVDTSNSSPPKNRSTRKPEVIELSSADERKENFHGTENGKTERQFENNKNARSKGYRQRKWKLSKAAHYQSAPDLTQEGNDANYDRSLVYSDDNDQCPQSWMQELAQGESLAQTVPLMERHITYNTPNGSANVAESFKYPPNDRRLGLQSVPFSMHFLPKPFRPLRPNMSKQQHYASMPMVSLNSNIKRPGPRTSANLNSMPLGSQPVSPEYGYGVQSHFPPGNSSTLPSRNHNRNSLTPFSYQTLPQHASSTLPSSYAPTPKPRNMGPTALNRHGNDRNYKTTATSARGDFESMLTSNYELSEIPHSREHDREYPQISPGYKPNQEISVDVVAFRKQPEIAGDEESLAESDVERNGYSSGFDLEMPEGFCFNSESGETGARRGKKKDHTRNLYMQSARNTKDEAALKQTSMQHDQSLQPAAISKSANPERKPGPKAKGTKATSQHRTVVRKEEKRMVDRSTSFHSENNVCLSKAKTHMPENATNDKHKKQLNKEIQHPPIDDSYEKIITPSKKWFSETRRNHDIGEGAKPTRPNVQSPQLRESPKRPVHILNPITPHEAIIDESLSSESESDLPQGQMQQSICSSSSSQPTSSPSASNFDPGRAKESVTDNMVKNSRTYISSKRRNPPMSSSFSSTDSESAPVSTDRPTPMVTKVSESIQVSSHTGKGGEVFSHTRSSSGPSRELEVPSKEDDRSVEYVSHLEPWQDRQMEHVYGQFKAHEVGKWVLECYAQDQKSKPKSEIQNETNLAPFSRAASKSRKTPVPTVRSRSIKQQAVEDVAFVGGVESKNTKSPNIPKLLPAASKVPSDDKDNIGFQRSLNRSRDSSVARPMGEELDGEKELNKTRLGIAKQRLKTQERAWKPENYKAQLSRWNDSPASNVEIAKERSVTDDDGFDPPQVVKSTSNDLSSFTDQTKQEGDYESEISFSDLSCDIPLQGENTKEDSHLSISSDGEESNDCKSESTLSESSGKPLSQGKTPKQDFFNDFRIPSFTNQSETKMKSYDSVSKLSNSSDEILSQGEGMKEGSCINPQICFTENYNCKSTLSESSSDIPRQKGSLEKDLCREPHNQRTTHQYEKDSDSDSVLSGSYDVTPSQEKSLEEDSYNDPVVLSSPSQYRELKYHNSSASLDKTLSQREMINRDLCLESDIRSPSNRHKKAKDCDVKVKLSQPSHTFLSSRKKPKEDICSAPIFISSNRDEDVKSSKSNSTSSESSDDILSRRTHLKRDLGINSPSNLKVEEILKPHLPLEPTVTQKDKPHQNATDKKDGPSRKAEERSVKPSQHIYGKEEWRTVGYPKIHCATNSSAMNGRDNLIQRSHRVQRAQTQEKSDEMRSSLLNHKPKQRAKVRSVSLTSEESCCLKPLENPFLDVDRDEIDSIVMKVPGRGSWEKPGFERELLESLEKTRQESKQETLEERKARILGICGKTSTDHESSKDFHKGNQRVKKAASESPKIDLNTYMNNLLTGVTDVPSEVRKNYFLANKGKKDGDMDECPKRGNEKSNASEEKL